MSPFFFYLAHLAVLAYALVGGVFLAFSDFIMRALSVTSGYGGAEAMQAINREVFRWVFMTLFLGLAACGGNPPAPIEDRGAAGSVDRSGRYTVARGDTLYSIAVIDVSDDATLVLPDMGDRYLSASTPPPAFLELVQRTVKTLGFSAEEIAGRVKDLL